MNSLREDAIEWWKELEGLEQRHIFLKYYNPFERTQSSLTGSEIEKMFINEALCIQSIQKINPIALNQKQSEIVDLLSKFVKDFPLHRGMQIMDFDIKRWVEKNVSE